MADEERLEEVQRWTAKRRAREASPHSPGLYAHGATEARGGISLILYLHVSHHPKFILNSQLKFTPPRIDALIEDRSVRWAERSAVCLGTVRAFALVIFKNRVGSISM